MRKYGITEPDAWKWRLHTYYIVLYNLHTLGVLEAYPTLTMRNHLFQEITEIWVKFSLLVYEYCGFNTLRKKNFHLSL